MIGNGMNGKHVGVVVTAWLLPGEKVRMRRLGLLPSSAPSIGHSDVVRTTLRHPLSPHMEAVSDFEALSDPLSLVFLRNPREEIARYARVCKFWSLVRLSLSVLFFLSLSIGPFSHSRPLPLPLSHHRL